MRDLLHVQSYDLYKSSNDLSDDSYASYECQICTNCEFSSNDQTIELTSSSNDICQIV